MAPFLLSMTTLRSIETVAPVRTAPADALYGAITLAGVLPALRTPRVPSDVTALLTPGAGCSATSAARCARADHIADLIADALTGAARVH